ncbi:MAG: GNAT family N-acetyltransferase [Coprobacillus sp.]
MLQVIINQPKLLLQTFVFFAGEPSIELLHHKVWDDFIILVPQNLAWAELMAEEFPQATQRERYATRKDVNHFDKELLLKNISHLSDNYILKEIDENLYNQLISQEWSKDLCSQFVTSAQFLESGIGFVVKENDEVIAGVSSYTVYQGGNRNRD